MNEFDEYIVHGEPGQKEKADAWQTAISLQDVDGVKVSTSLLDTARQHIEDDISIYEARERIKTSVQSITAAASKSQFDTFNCTLEELAVLPAIEDNPKSTQTEIAKSIKKSSNPDVVPPDSITIKEAARWMATIASTDGVITPSERMLLKEFAETHGIEPNSLLRMAHAIANKIDVPEVEFFNRNKMKGRLFEEFVVRLTSDSSRFTLLNWSSDKYVDGIYSLDTLMPDLYLRHQLDSETVEYYVECKYRSSLPDGVLDICSQLSRYRHMISTDTKKELFIAIGLGGTPSEPELFYMIPSRMIKNGNAIFIDHFSKCLCPKNPEGFHNYISHYFSKRVFKQI